MPGDLESRFHRAMVGIYTEAKRQLGYNATRFLEMVANEGGLQTAKILLHGRDDASGLLFLMEHNRPDLTMESLVLQAQWDPLFTDEEREIARRRLDWGSRRS